jgi:tetratricopeptide (TPR) repeat protein
MWFPFRKKAAFPTWNRVSPSALQVPPILMGKPISPDAHLFYRMEPWGHRNQVGPHFHLEWVPNAVQSQYAATGRAPGVTPLDLQGKPTSLAGSRQSLAWEAYPAEAGAGRQRQLLALLGAVRGRRVEIDAAQASSLQDSLAEEKEAANFYLSWLLLELAPANERLEKLAWTTLAEPCAMARAEAASYILRINPKARESLLQRYGHDPDPYLQYELGRTPLQPLPIDLQEILGFVSSRVETLDPYELLRCGRVEEAAEGLRATLARDPDHYESIYCLGLACLMMDKNEESEALIARANRMQPQDSRPWSKLGSLALRRHRHAQAVEYLRQAIALKRDEVDLNNLGLAYQLCGRPAEAREAFLQALDHNPEFEPARLNLEAAGLKDI